MKKIIVTGATGLIGKKLVQALISRGDEVIIFSRNALKAKSIFPKAKNWVEWNYKNSFDWQMYLENCDALVHLAGTNVFAQRWNDDFKNKILESRKDSTRSLIEAIKNSNKKPQVFISASGVGYYGNSGENILMENSPAGNDFLAEVCKIWEQESAKVEQFGIRRVSIRTGIVLSLEDGALKQMITPFKFFIGGHLGNGRQWFPWIHIDDVVNIYLFALDNSSISGAVNAVAPEIVRMKVFAKVLGKILQRLSLFPVPNIILKIVIGESAEVITASQNVSAKKLLLAGFDFKFNSLTAALKNLIDE